MLNNYLIVALRSLRRQKGYAAINVVGLALGLAAFLFLAFWVQDERSFDRFHTHADRLYRLNKVFTPPEGPTARHALSPGPMGPTLEADFPDVEAAIRVMPAWGGMLLVHGETTLPTPDVLFADAEFLDAFDFRLLRGDPSTALVEPLSLVLSEHLAHALFGDADPLGQTLVGAGELTYTVTGIVEDVPAQSHLRYNALASWSTLVTGNGGLEAGWLERWLPQSIFTYVLLRPGADPAALEAKMPAFMATHFPERADQYHFYLQPLRDVYLGSTDVLYQRSMVQGNRAYVYVLGIVGVLILLIACANFTNLATARAMQRGKEVGVRKSVGAQRGQLVVRFLGEAVVLVGLALVAALALVEGFRPAFNAFTGKAAPAYAWAAPEVLLGLAGLTVLVALAAGLYPAVVLSGFRPAQALKGGDTVGGHRFRQILVTAQFAASIALLVGTAVVYQQMRFAQTQHPGYDREQIVVLPIGPTGLGQQIEPFRDALVRHPGVAAATGSSDVPGESFSTYTIVPEGRPEDEGLTAAALFLDDTDLLQTYGIDLAAGRFFAPDRPADSSAVVINEAMARTFGWTDAIGKRIDVPGEGGEHTVIGVVEDFQTASMHQAVAPLFMALQPSGGYMSVRITGEDVPATLAHLRATWERFEPRYPFDYSFLDETFAQLYAADRQLMRTLGLFAGLAVLIACLGLFGLAAYAAQQRRKEIGVRKVLGASVGSVVALLTRDFAALVLVGFAVAVPLAWWAMDRWLDGFAYRVALGPGVFVAAGLVALAVALAAVSGQAFRAAAADPVDALRNE